MLTDSLPLSVLDTYFAISRVNERSVRLCGISEREQDNSQSNGGVIIGTNIRAIIGAIIGR